MVDRSLEPRMRRLAGAWLDDEEIAVKRFAAQEFPLSSYRHGTDVWVYLTSRRLLYTDVHSGMALAADGLTSLVGARVHKQEIDLFFHEDARTVRARRLWVRPKRVAAEFVQVLLEIHDEVCVPPLDPAAIRYATEREARGWAPPPPQVGASFRTT